MKKITIFQEYVPRYREDFFSLLHEDGMKRGYRVRVVVQRISNKEILRLDGITSSPEWLIKRDSWETRVGSFRIRFGFDHTWKRNEDCVVYEQARRNLPLYFSLLWRFFYKSYKLLLWGHGSEAVAVGRVRSLLFDTISLLADGVFTYTQQGADALVSKRLKPPSKVFVLNNTNGVEVLRRDLRDIPRSERRTMLRLLYVGALVDSKGILELVQTFKKLDSGGRVSLDVVGDGPLLPRLHELAIDTPSLRVLGRLDGRDKAHAFANADLVVNPYEVGLVAVDALVAGLPVLYVENARHGPEVSYLVQAQAEIVIPNIESLGESIIRIAGKPDYLDQLSANASAYSENFSTATMVEVFLDGLADALGEKHSK